MKHFVLTIIVCLILPQKMWAQQNKNESIQSKIIEGLVYALDQHKSSPKDLVICRTVLSEKFYLISSFNGIEVEAKEITPPDLNKIIDLSIVINMDSIYDILWIRNKDYQTILLSDSEIPFKKLKSRFKDDKIKALKSDIKLLKDKAYFVEISTKYGDLRVIETTSLKELLLKSDKDAKLLSLDVVYPALAREYGTQGQVKIAYVMRKNCDIEDVYVLQHLEDGCTESVIKAIMQLSVELKEAQYDCKEDVLFLLAIDFILN
ncbi:MAG: energy transducer TonB [Bacteroidales bacterium]|nr:energy transducer TonB [Bacteroidales bacterium]MDD4575159.1 energy transducer TonB [Bacteroidales bacterium]